MNGSRSLTVPASLRIARTAAPRPLRADRDGVMFGPEDALRHGYLDYVVDPAQLDAAVEPELARLRALDRPAFVATKARINARALESIRAAIAAEL
jgi:enoyl-CoA hydratase/carnithine racemase